ncbi:MAG: fibronectin type III-like domain-contianing protein, partial [Bosea sp. (in: a-proteobacteria)]
PGETRRITLNVPARDLGFHDDEGRYRIEPGAFEVYVGRSSQAALSGKFDLIAR